MRIVLASRAVADLSDIGRFIARDHPLRVAPDRLFIHRILGRGQDQDRALGLR